MIVRLMESNAHPHVLVLGHSFVKRMIFYLRPGKKLKDLRSLNFAEGFNLKDVRRVSMLGIGGRTVEKLLRYDLKAIRARQTEIFVLEIGSNNLCDASWEPQAIVEAIHSCGQLLLQSLNLKQLIFCGSFLGFSPTFRMRSIMPMCPYSMMRSKNFVTTPQTCRFGSTKVSLTL